MIIRFLKDKLVFILFLFCVTSVSAQTYTNVSKFKPTTASSHESAQYSSAKANDGDNTNTRWASSFNDNQWWQVDLGAPTRIERIKIYWEGAYAQEYKIVASNDESVWTHIAISQNGDGGIDEHIASMGIFQYVRILCEKRATVYGSSFYEFKVYTSDAPEHQIFYDPTPGGTISGASSVSDGGDVYISHTEKPGYTYGGFRIVTGNAGNGVDHIYGVFSDVYLEGIFIADPTHTITYQSSVGGTVSGPSSVVENGTVSLTNSVNAGYTFTGYRIVSGTATLSGNQLSNVASNITLEGQFASQTFPISYINDGNGVVTGPATVVYNGTVSLASTANTGYVFDRYEIVSGSATLSGDQLINVTSAVTVNGVFTQSSSPAVIQGEMTDWRDGKTYKTVTIGTLTWMAENLNFETAMSSCYNDIDANCAITGQFYSWDEVVPTSPRLCPGGFNTWRMPTKDDWNELLTYVAANSNSGTAKSLRSPKRWDWGYGIGDDTFKFSALPGGAKNGLWGWAGSIASWWSSTEHDTDEAWRMYINGTRDGHISKMPKSIRVSVRCVTDHVPPTMP
ncbi:MAG: discoidin domain-containing protein [Fibrobacterales bacterium]